MCLAIGHVLTVLTYKSTFYNLKSYHDIFVKSEANCWHILYSSTFLIQSSFNRCYELANLAEAYADCNPEYRIEYDEIRKQCKRLTADILDQCNETNEVNLLLQVNFFK